MNRLFLMPGLLMLLVIVVFAGCSTEPDEPDAEPILSQAAADSTASYWMQELGDTLETMLQGQSLEYYKGLRFTDIENGVDQALAGNPASRVANLARAVLYVIEINYNEDLWALIDSLEAYANDEPSPPDTTPKLGIGLHLQKGSPILKNQFTLLATAPRELAWRMSSVLPTNITVMRMQQIIEEAILPKLESAISHMGAAEAGGGPIILIHLEDEEIEIDLGEVLFFDASLRAARAGLLIATAYDLDLPGPDGTYGWVDQVREIEDRYIDDCTHNYAEIDTIGTRTVRHYSTDYDWQGIGADSILVAVFEHNLMNRPAFLALRHNRMNDAYNELRMVVDKIQAAVAAIRDETDPQENDVVRMMYLTDLDADIAGAYNRPEFAQNFTTVEDVLNWVETVLSGTYHLAEDADCGRIELDVNLQAFLTSPPQDLRALLPYHRFKAHGDWVTREALFSYGYPNTGEYCWWWACEPYACYPDIQQVEYWYRNAHIDPIEILDGPGGAVVDLAVVKVPYMPDYTMAGLLPGATRDTWLLIYWNALCGDSPGQLSSR